MHLLFPCWRILLFLLTFPLCLWLGNLAKIIRQAPLSPMLLPLERTSSRHPQSLYSFKGSAPRTHLPRVPSCGPGSWACLTRVQLGGSSHSDNLVMLFRLVLISTSIFFLIKKESFLAMLWSLWYFIPPIKDWTQALGSKSMESYPLLSTEPPVNCLLYVFLKNLLLCKNVQYPKSIQLWNQNTCKTNNHPNKIFSLEVI